VSRHILKYLTMTALIQVFVLNVATGDIVELPFESINHVEELNNGKNATIEFDYSAVEVIADKYGTTVKDLFTATFREIQIYVDGVKKWRVVIAEYNRSKDAEGKYTLTIGAVDYFSILQKRRTGLTTVNFAAVDPATIPWSLINASQLLTSGDLGITVGATDTTALSVTLALKNAEIRQTIIDLSNYKQLNSFDFDLDIDNKLNIFAPTKGSLRQTLSSMKAISWPTLSKFRWSYL